MNMNNKIKKHGNVRLPSKYGDFELSAYSIKEDDPMPHLVLSSKSIKTEEAVNVRIHSECITGDLFGSLRCECGEQLATALKYIKKNSGIVIYLRQEGRGIGIINKIKAYIEQDKGYDTAQANQRLGFDKDSRKYDEAIHILKLMGVSKINLLTNNPDKISAFDDTGIMVDKRLPIEIRANDHNGDYLKTKKDVFGHLLETV